MPLYAGRGEPLSFIVGREEVIRGMDEGVRGLLVGQRARLHVNAQAGYGSAGSGGSVLGCVFSQARGGRGLANRLALIYIYQRNRESKSSLTSSQISGFVLLQRPSAR